MKSGLKNVSWNFSLPPWAEGGARVAERDTARVALAMSSLGHSFVYLFIYGLFNDAVTDTDSKL
jgi:hypothetical protein